MKQVTLKPILDKDQYSNLVAKQLEFELYIQVFRPILEIFGLSWAQVRPQRTNAKERWNAKSAVAEALNKGRIALLGQYFKGNMSAAMSKEILAMGGVWDNRLKAWKIEIAKLPTEVLLAVQKSRESSHEKIDKALKELEKIAGTGIEPTSLNKITDHILQDLDKQLKRTTGKEQEIPLAMSGYIEDELKTKYTENLNLYIKNWTDEAVVRLRGQIEENATQGYRAESMRQAIIAEYGVSAKKAKFLARQETGLMVANYREANYKEAGINFYQWSTSGDQRVRDSHKELNGQIFSWSDPPIVDPLRGRRAHPGCDFGCRCVAVPVLMSQMERITAMAKGGKVFKGDLTTV